MQLIRRFFTVFALLTAMTSYGYYDVSIKTSLEDVVLQINPQDTLENALAQISSVLQSTLSELSEVPSIKIHYDPETLHLTAEHVSSSSSSSRDYYRPVSASEKADMRFILKNLSSASWFKLLDMKSALDAAGNRIDHIHPLRFLVTIFSNEELKAYIHGMRSQKLIWKKFFSTLADNLEKESISSNLKKEYIKHFSNEVNVEESLFLNAIEQRRWDEFLSILFKHIPRGGNPERYNMRT